MVLYQVNNWIYKQLTVEPNIIQKHYKSIDHRGTMSECKFWVVRAVQGRCNNQFNTAEIALLLGNYGFDNSLMSWSDDVINVSNIRWSSGFHINGIQHRVVVIGSSYGRVVSKSIVFLVHQFDCMCFDPNRSDVISAVETWIHNKWNYLW